MCHVRLSAGVCRPGLNTFFNTLSLAGKGSVQTVPYCIVVYKVIWRHAYMAKVPHTIEVPYFLN
jgi:hypothetical protein